MNYKLCELYNKYTILSKYEKNNISFKQLLVCVLFHCFGCCKYARMIFHCATVLVVLSICALRGNIADDAMQMDDKSLYPFYTTKEMPHVTVTITKNALLAAVARYISITTIYTVGYLQIFNTGHFFSAPCGTEQTTIDTGCGPALPRNCVDHPADCNLFKTTTLLNSR